MKTQNRITEFQNRLFNFRTEVRQRIEQLLPMYFDKAAEYSSQPMLVLDTPLTFTHCTGSGYLTGIITGTYHISRGPKKTKLPWMIWI